MAAAWVLVALSEWTAAAKRARWRLDEIAPPVAAPGDAGADSTGPWSMPVVEATALQPVRPFRVAHGDRDAAGRAGADADAGAAAEPVDPAEPEEPEPPGAGCDCGAAARSDRRGRSVGALTRLAAAAALLALAATPAAANLRPALRPAPALQVPAGFSAEVYASGLKRPTALAFGAGGLLYATQESGEVVAVGRGSTRPRVLARGFRSPLGLAWQGETLYVSAQGSLHRLVVRGKRVVSRRAILTGLPFGRHQQDTVAIGPDGRLYLGSGSTCDVCRERDRRSAAVLSVRPDGSDLRVVARGLRNPFGLAFQPGTNRLYVSDNGRDDLGRSEPAETIVEIRPGADYGWPRCWASWSDRRLRGACAGVAKPSPTSSRTARRIRSPSGAARSSWPSGAST